MSDTYEEKRKRAIKRCRSGEKPKQVYTSLGQSKAWFYKWLKRYTQGNNGWYKSQLRSPHTIPTKTSKAVEDMVVAIRKYLKQEDLFCGAQHIQWELEDRGISFIPSKSTIYRILHRHKLIKKENKRYISKHKTYPSWKAEKPGDVFQSDFVGPCYIEGPLRFYSLHTVDIATGRCAVEPVIRGKSHIIQALWATWKRLGKPKIQQVDNELCFFGSHRHPRGMGKLIRLCLLNNIEPCFIPFSEPWRNGVVEQFNNHWRNKFKAITPIKSAKQLQEESLKFECRHNTRYRYTKLRGKTPLEMLRLSDMPLAYPPDIPPPKHPLKKPREGRYHVIRFIRSDGIMDIFGEQFRVPRQAIYEYVKATIDVKEQTISLYIDSQCIDQKEYRL